MRTTKRIVAVAAMLLAMSQAWAGDTYFTKTWVKAQATPVGAGEVYVKLDSKNSGGNDTDLASKKGETSEINAPTKAFNNERRVDYYLYAEAKPGYNFQGWSEELKDEYTDADFINGDWQCDGTRLGSLKVSKEFATLKVRSTTDKDAWDKIDTIDDPTSVDFTFYAVFSDSKPMTLVRYREEDNPGNGGTIGTVTCSKDEVFNGDVVTLTAVASPGCKFEKWVNSKNETFDNPTIEVTADGYTFYVPYFQLEPVQISSATNVTTYSNLKGVTFNDDQKKFLRAFAAKVLNGYVVLTESTDGLQSNQGAILFADPKGEKYSDNIDKDITFNKGAGLSDYTYSRVFANNGLKNTAAGTVTSDGRQYVLKNGAEGLGFYLVEAGEVIPTNIAYVELEEANAKDFLPLLRAETFVNGDNWENVYAYAWQDGDDNNKPFGDWPGTQLTGSDAGIANVSVEQYVATLDVTAKNSGANYKIIFSNGDGTQTANLDFKGGLFVQGNTLAVNIIDWDNKDTGINVEGATWVANNDVTVYGGTHTAKTFAFTGEMNAIPTDVTFTTGYEDKGTAKFLVGEYLAYDYNGGTGTKFVVLDAAAPVAIKNAAAVGAKICYDRQFTVDKVATVSLPFALSAEEVEAAGKFYELSSYADGVVHFTETATVEPNVPYVFVAAKEYPFETIADQGFVGVAAESVVKGDATFKNFVETTAIAGVYGIKDGEFVKVNSGTANPYRAVVELAGAAPAKLAVDLDGTTGISEMSSEEMISAPIFDLQGRRIQTISKGLYIQNGKKFIVK